MNLVINARDAMPDGGKISISGDNESIGESNSVGLPPGDYLVLSVEDTGSGIPPEILEEVLEPFFTTKEVGKGTGLGLSMVYGFAKQSGGGISIKSRVGRGTRVEIWLPRAPELAAAARLGENAASADLEDATLKPLKVLLVDDHPSVRSTTAALLSDLGHDVAEAGDARDALALIDEPGREIDLLVTDYAMPLMSGTELIEKARQRRPGLPALIITGYADAQSISRRPEDVVVIAKPFTPQQLTTALANGAAGLRDALEVTVQPIRAQA
jgi:CheY-like chemotaxis protein